MPITTDYPRDLIGYGRNPPQAQWPGQARVAVQFVLNYEEGGENSVLHGDAGSEQFLSEMFSPASFAARHLSMESIYEYGSRVGVWRILREFERRGLPLRHVDTRGSCAGLLRQLADAAPQADVVLVHAGASELSRLFSHRGSAFPFALGEAYDVAGSVVVVWSSHGSPDLVDELT